MSDWNSPTLTLTQTGGAHVKFRQSNLAALVQPAGAGETGAIIYLQSGATFFVKETFADIDAALATGVSWSAPA